MLVTAAAAAAAATTAGLAYVDAKFHLRKDLTVIRGRKKSLKAWDEACMSYHCLTLIQLNVDL